MQQEQALRQRTQNQLAWLAEAQARAGGRYEGVRVRVAPNQVEQVRQMLGDKAQVDGQAGADGRLGVNILYNANASSRQVSQALELVRAAGGEVFERPADATRRAQQVQQDQARLAGWRAPSLHRDWEQER
jgi:hypothetical protein